jgi:hypothetical protein
MINFCNVLAKYKNTPCHIFDNNFIIIYIFFYDLNVYFIILTAKYK